MRRAFALTSSAAAIGACALLVGIAGAVGLTPGALRATSPRLAPLTGSPLPGAELVTVTDHSFDATWPTQKTADTTVCVGTAPDRQSCQRQEQATSFHYAEVNGLAPGTRYFYTLRSAGTDIAPSPTNPGTFRTLTPPPGRHLFDFALLSDIHIGEQCSGTAFTAPLANQSLPPCFSDGDYAAQMAQAAVQEIKARGIGLLVVSADITSDASYDQAQQAKAILTQAGASVDITRGNHDRPGQHPGDARCGHDHDCLRAVFFPARPPGRIYYSFDHNGYHFVVLDSNDAQGTGDLTDQAQNAFLERDLNRHRATKTFIVFHEPVAEYADTAAVPPVVFGVAPNRGGTQFLALMRRFPNVVGVLNSHTHRNFVAYSPQTGARLPYIENGAEKEYPGGYGVFHVYSGGYTRNFYRPRNCDFCRQWTETTRGEYAGLYPLYILGPLSTRNFTHVYDCPVPTPPPSLPGDDSLLQSTDFSTACPRQAPGAGGHHTTRRPIHHRSRIRLSVEPRRVPAGVRIRYCFRATTTIRRIHRAVAGARIRFAATGARTNARGVACIVKRLQSPGRHRAVVTKSGLASGTTIVTATRRRQPPRFTG